jgi:hypothetical protein
MVISNHPSSIVPDPSHPGRTKGRCEILPARLLGSGLTYRYGADSLFPMGYGLSYSSFAYSALVRISTYYSSVSTYYSSVVSHQGRRASSPFSPLFVKCVFVYSTYGVFGASCLRII